MKKVRTTTPTRLGMVPSRRFQTKAISGSPAVIRRCDGFAGAHQRVRAPVDIGRCQGRLACITVMSGAKQALCQLGLWNRQMQKRWRQSVLRPSAVVPTAGNKGVSEYPCFTFRHMHEIHALRA
jgi:hypothetical protein